MTRTEKKSRMFHLDGDKEVETYNPFHGCSYQCYQGQCWAEQMSKRMTNVPHYPDDDPFAPATKPGAFQKTFPDGATVFLGSMGDISQQPAEVRNKTIDLIQNNPGTRFLLCTKNPAVYQKHDWPSNALLGSTIETNRDKGYSQYSNAPIPSKRLEAMKTLNHPHLHVSMEPVMDFDPNEMLRHLEDIDPEIVSIGYGNYGTKVPEPSLDEVKSFINTLESETKVTVERKTLRKRR